MEFDQEMLDIFLEEFNSLLLILETEINKGSNNQKVNVKEIFRVFHTLKGNSATLEYKRLHTLADAFCEYFREKQDQNMVSTTDLVGLERSFSVLNRFLISIKNGRKGKRIKIKPAINSLKS